MSKAFLFDLDGVFYISNRLIEGGNETLAYLRSKHIPFRFVTNTTTFSRKKLWEKLSGLGLELLETEIVSANYSGVLYLKKQQAKSCKLILEETAKEDYRSFNIQEKHPEYIVIGDIGNRWNYDLMNELMNDVLEGSQIIALHKGRYFQTDEGLKIDAGAFIAGIEYVTQQKTIVIGKPVASFFELAASEFECLPHEITMVGDDLINDIYGAQQMGYRSILVKTGKYREEIYKASSIRPDSLIPSIVDIIEECKL
jgi:HAD superfamily hydrolase (TIGR01458 family)